jgi:hypothetical protein
VAWTCSSNRREKRAIAAKIRHGTPTIDANFNLCRVVVTARTP